MLLQFYEAIFSQVRAEGGLKIPFGSLLDTGFMVNLISSIERSFMMNKTGYSLRCHIFEHEVISTALLLAIDKLSPAHVPRTVKYKTDYIGHTAEATYLSLEQ
ncbi:hypothetical protein O3G_MSEX010400 [Manduca sexta]|uniref:Uncharacterized protein n=1 Tax=Manduca sexta TaxID=7130 RepID=A0A921ZHB9_MANSE|nr:hypothetical protein O3G_MSEX010400 [Manduca sexta]